MARRTGPRGEQGEAVQVPEPPERRGGLGRSPSSRVWARVRGRHLDRALADGFPPGWSGAMTARAAFLTGEGQRRKLAASWLRMLDRCGGPEPQRCRSLAVALVRRRVLAAAPEIRLLAASLEAADGTSVRGVAAAKVLLADCAGPLYDSMVQVSLGDALRAATQAITARSEPVPKPCNGR